MKINERGEKMVEHHVKYKEIHGVDETVWMTYGEHRLLHNQLRKDGKCGISVKELRDISHCAQNRTAKRREYCKGWTKKNPDYMREYRKEWRKRNRDKINQESRERYAQKKREKEMI